MKQIIIIHSSLDLSGEIISVLQHLENLLIVLLQHYPGYLGPTNILWSETQTKGTWTGLLSWRTRLRPI